MLAACASGTGTTSSLVPEAPPPTIAGSVVLADVLVWKWLGNGDGAEEGDPCTGDEEDGFGDIDQGTRIVVRDGLDEVIGTASLELGVLGPAETWQEALVRDCRMLFQVQLSRAADFYTIEVGDRADFTFSQEELVGNAWTAEVTIGA